MTVATSLHRTIDRSKILQAAAAIGVFGSAARNAPLIMGTLCDPDVPREKVVEVVSADPVLSARVLRVANSAFYGQARSIVTIERALIVLGRNAVRGIAAAACLDRTPQRAQEFAGFDAKALVHHSVATAVAAERLAKMGHSALTGEAFIAGLLHNLGTFVQLQLDPKGLAAMLEDRRSDPSREIRSVEREFAAIGHEECAAVLFEAWNLPPSLIAAARYHHEPLAAAAVQRDLAALVHLADGIALAGGATYPLQPASSLRNAQAMTWLRLSHSDLDTVEHDLLERVTHFKNALLGVTRAEPSLR